MVDKADTPSKGAKIAAAITVIVVIIIIILAVSSLSKKDTTTNLASQVNTSLHKLGDTSVLASEAGGKQGDIVKVENGSSDEVKVTVSTDFSSPDEGKAIANRIYASVCTDIKDLNSLYVINQSTGLESYSVYRSDIPACNSIE